MDKRIYISADYAENNGDRAVVEELKRWGRDNYHLTDFIDMAEVISGSVSLNNPNCRICELKEEFNRQIKASSIVLLVVGDRTKTRTAGSSCGRAVSGYYASCTPYKQNANGIKPCNRYDASAPHDGSVNPVNQYSYLRHEFEQAKVRNKKIVIVYNSLRCESHWLPSYMSAYEYNAVPFWKYDGYGHKVGDYTTIKRLLGYA